MELGSGALLLPGVGIGTECLETSPSPRLPKD